MFGDIPSVLLFAIIVVVVVTVVLWVLLPFAVFGVKRLLSELIAEQKKTNTLLSKAVQQSEEER